jgi:tetratricopeptide (TPR) repeat protein
MRKNFEVMSVRMNRWLACLLCSLMSFVLIGCSDAPVVSKSPAANGNTQSATGKPTPATTETRPATPTQGGGGDPIDTAKLDEEVTRAEKDLKKKPADKAARASLAHAYLARAGALTKARQYRSALGDYRRTLQYDPQNEEALEMSERIVSIMKSMGREVPAEGEEPPPLPYKKENSEAEGSPKKSY